MATRSGWHSLQAYLEAQDGDVVLTLEEIGELRGKPLPPSAARHSAYWANGGHPHASAWMDAGFRSTLAGVGPDEVRFCRASPRVRVAPAPTPEPVAATILDGTRLRDLAAEGGSLHGDPLAPSPASPGQPRLPNVLQRLVAWLHALLAK